MPRRIEEPVSVTLAPNGEPRSFVWEQYEYEVIGIPQNFFQLREWWREEMVSLDRIDQELWRVQASADGNTFRLYDLLRRPGGEGWMLTLEWQ